MKTVLRILGLVSLIPASAAMAKDDGPPICNIEPSAFQTPFNQFSVVTGGSTYTRGSAITSTATLEDALAQLELLKGIGACYAAPPEKRQACTIAHEDNHYAVIFNQGSVLHGATLLTKPTLAEAMDVIVKLQKASLCRTPAASQSQPRTGEAGAVADAAAPKTPAPSRSQVAPTLDARGGTRPAG